jgi:hypothetical protein
MRVPIRISNSTGVACGRSWGRALQRDSRDLCNAPRWEPYGSNFDDKPCIFYTFHVHSVMLDECHVIPVGSRSAVTTTASSLSIESAKILSWASEPIPAKSRRFT